MHPTVPTMPDQPDEDPIKWLRLPLSHHTTRLSHANPPGYHPQSGAEPDQESRGPRRHPCQQYLSLRQIQRDAGIHAFSSEHRKDGVAVLVHAQHQNPHPGDQSGRDVNPQHRIFSMERAIPCRPAPHLMIFQNPDDRRIVRLGQCCIRISLVI